MRQSKSSTAPRGTLIGTRSRRHDRGEDAVALVELSVVIPLVIFLIVGVFEIGRGFFNYMILSHIAYEGARTASQMGIIDEGCYADYYQLHDQSPPSTGGQLSHWLVQERVALLSNTVFSDILDVGHYDGQQFIPVPEISTMYIFEDDVHREACGNMGEPGARTDENVVGVKVTGVYNGLFLPVSYTVSAESRASYLFNTQANLPMGDGDPSDGLEERGLFPGNSGGEQSAGYGSTGEGSGGFNPSGHDPVGDPTGIPAF